MPRRITRDANVARSITAALVRLKAGQPKDAGLKRRSETGTLKINFNTIEIESGVKRHIFDRPGTCYEAEHKAIEEAMTARGKVEPLRMQLNKNRALLQATEKRLDRSRSYAAQVLVRMQKLETEVSRLNEELANGGTPHDEPALIGEGRVPTLPPMPRRRKPMQKGAAAQSARGVGR